MFVYVPQSSPSPEAVALGHRIAEAVRLLREENPDIGSRDVRIGLRLAETELRSELGGADTQKVLVVAGVLAMLVGGGVLFVVRGGVDLRAPILWALIGLGALVAVIVALRAR